MLQVGIVKHGFSFRIENDIITVDCSVVFSLEFIDIHMLLKHCFYRTAWNADAV